jgi:hypothetical protein
MGHILPGVAVEGTAFGVRHAREVEAREEALER